jgi:uncharacterized protein YgbK (DUF1537 family)
VGDTLVPVAETEFARDAVFGYRSSNLREWVREKMANRISSSSIHSISIDDLRVGGAGTVENRLLAVPRGGVVIVNAAGPGDLAVLTHALATLESQGKRYLFRTAADFVRAYAAIEPRPLLTANELRLPTMGGGLVVAGSYVKKTSEQLAELFARVPELCTVELPVAEVLNPRQCSAAVAATAQKVSAALVEGRDVALFTSRTVVNTSSQQQFASDGQEISRALIDIIAHLFRSPRWLVAKGGITSSDVATRGLGIRRAIVLGQALPGVPVWKCGEETRWPGLPYIVFPGNVGDKSALAELVAMLRSG